MAFITEERHGESFPYYTGEGTGLCRPIKLKVQYHDSTRKYEFVESWRGPHLYSEMVNGKRKRRYNRFRSFKFVPNPPNGANDCIICGNNRVAYYEPMPLSVFNPTVIAGARLLGPTYWVDLPPYVSQEDLAELGDRYRMEVIRDIYAKANAPRFNSSVFIAELDETLIGVKDLLQGALKALWRPNGLYRSFKHFSLNSEEVWLWWRYALMPAILGADELLASLKTPRFVDCVRDGSEFEETYTGTALSKRWTRALITAEFKWRQDVRVACGGAMDISAKSDPSPWGFSTWDTVMAVWERIPLSFVLDWFVNLGEYLQSLRDANVEVVQSYATYAVDVQSWYSGGNNVQMSDFSTHTALIDRIVDIEPPKFPLVDKRWRNLLRTIDSITLIVSLLKGKLPEKRKRRRR